MKKILLYSALWFCIAMMVAVLLPRQGHAAEDDNPFLTTDEPPANPTIHVTSPNQIAPPTGGYTPPADADINLFEGNPFPAAGEPANFVEISPDQQALITAQNKADAARGRGGGTPPPPPNGGGSNNTECSSVWQHVTSPITCQVAILANAAMWISAKVLWIAGVLLNGSLYYTLHMDVVLNGLPIVDVGWTIIRDIANILFIFIALWSGLSIILLGEEKASKAWGLLAQMVLVALFINFSLFITKTVVDVSNVAALHFHSLINQPESSIWNGGISDAFMNGLNIQSVYNSRTIQNFNADSAGQYISSAAALDSTVVLTWGNVLIIGVLGSVLMLVTAFVFFAAAILMIIRTIVLIMLMVLSPLAFVSWLLPGAQALGSKWWHTLWSQAFFAPLYLALAYVVVRAVSSGSPLAALAGGGPIPSYAALFTGFNSASIVLIFYYLVLIGFLIGCLLIAQSLGAHGSGMVMGWGKKLAGETTSFVGRGAMRGFGLGWAGEALQEKIAEKKAKGEKVSTLAKVTAGAFKYSSIRNLNERLGQTWLGNLGVFKFLKEQTTGRLATAKFGGSKSAEEAYAESEKDASVRLKIGYLKKAREAGVGLQRLRGEQGTKYAERFVTEQKLSEAKEEVSEKMTAQVTPAQQQEIDQKEQDLETLKQNITAAHQPRIVAAQTALTQARQNLSANSNDPLLQAAVTAGELAVARAQTLSPAEQQQITAAEQAVATAQTPRWTPEQQQIQAKLEAVAVAEENLARNPTDPALIAARDRAKDALGQVSSAHKALAEAEKAYQAADADVNEYNDKHGQEIADNTKKMAQFLAKLSPKEFMEYMPKAEFFNPALMSMDVLPTATIDALMKDEHTLTEGEKDSAMHARYHDIIDVAKRGEVRWSQYHSDVQRFQKAENARDAAQVRIETQLTLPTSGVTLRAELENLDALREELATERARPKGAQDSQRIQALEQEIRTRTESKEFKDAIENRDERIEKMTERGELERPEMPKQPGWEEAPHLRKALRNMRGLTEISHWYQHARESLDLKLLAQTIMQGVWSDVRKSEQFDSSFKEDVGRGLKRAYIQFSGDLATGFDPNVTEAISKKKKFPMDELRRLANKRLTKLGPEQYFNTFNDSWTDDDGTKYDSILAQYLQLIRDANLEDADEREREERAMSNRGRMDIRFNGGMTMYDDVSQNLASNEFTLMQGLYRDLYVVMRNLEVSQIEHYRDRDLDVKIPMVNFLLEQFRDEILGIRKMTRENLQIFTWFVNQGGQNFIPFEKVRADLKDYWEQVKSIIGRTDARTPGSIYPRLRDNPTDDAPIIKHINDVRAKERTKRGLPPLPALTTKSQPFGRIGAVA